MFRPPCNLPGIYVFISRPTGNIRPSASECKVMLDPYFSGSINQTGHSLREVAVTSMGLSTPCVGLATALGYIDTARQATPARQPQALRDCFGAHTYRRVDKEGVFHTQ